MKKLMICIHVYKKKFAYLYLITGTSTIYVLYISRLITRTALAHISSAAQGQSKMGQLLDAVKQKLHRHEGAIRAQQQVGLIAASVFRQISKAERQAFRQIAKAERQALTQAVTDLQARGNSVVLHSEIFLLNLILKEPSYTKIYSYIYIYFKFHHTYTYVNKKIL